MKELWKMVRRMDGEMRMERELRREAVGPTMRVSSVASTFDAKSIIAMLKKGAMVKDAQRWRSEVTFGSITASALIFEAVFKAAPRILALCSECDASLSSSLVTGPSTAPFCCAICFAFFSRCLS